jgi:hypothetical protein
VSILQCSKTAENTLFQKLYLFLSSGERGNTALLGPLEKTNLSLDPVSKTLCSLILECHTMEKLYVACGWNGLRMCMSWTNFQWF